MIDDLLDRGPPRWIGRFVAAAAIVLVVGGWLALRSPRRSSESTDPAAERFVETVSPKGDLDAAPSEFRWRSVPEAARYTVRIADADAIWPLFVRSTETAALALDAKELSAFASGRIHVWEVEAFDASGKRVATGGTRFRIRRPDAAP